MIYGLTGAHRSGKSTLAKKIADDMGLHYLKVETAEVAKRHGFNPVAPMTYAQRVELQMILFDDFCKELEKAPRPLITDRTPLDHVAYLLGETTMLSGAGLDDKFVSKVEDFISRAVDYAVTRFDVIICLAPLPTYEIAPDKPPPNPIYQFAYAQTLWGLLYSLRERLSFVNIENPDFDFRVETVTTVIAQRLNWIQTERGKAPWVH